MPSAKSATPESDISNTENSKPAPRMSESRRETSIIPSNRESIQTTSSQSNLPSFLKAMCVFSDMESFPSSLPSIEISSSKEEIPSFLRSIQISSSKETIPSFLKAIDISDPSDIVPATAEPSQSPTAIDSEPVPLCLERFNLHKILGRGSYGKVSNYQIDSSSYYY